MTKRFSALWMSRTLAALALVAAVSAARAQGATQATTSFDSRWQAWLGCWQPADAPAIPGVRVPTVCVSPLNTASAVEVTMFDDSVLTMRDTIDASGVARQVAKQGCSGTETGRWSKDDHRVLLHSAMTCGAGLARSGNTILSMSPGGEWVDVQSMTVGNGTGVRTIHYRPASGTAKVPAALLRADQQMAISAARTEASGSLDVAGVREAVLATDTAVVQSWIIARGTRFNLDAKTLATLADAGIPGSVTDVMIGVSFPQQFALKEPARPAGNGFGVAGGDGYAQLNNYGRSGRCEVAAGASLEMRDACAACDQLGYDRTTRFSYDDCLLRQRYGYGLYNSYYSPYSYYSPFGYYGYGSYAYAYGASPVIIVRGSEQSHGKVVNGRGYSQGGSAGGQAGQARSGGGGSSSTGYTGSTGSTSTSSSSGSGASTSSSSGDGGRTAHARPPR